MSFTNLEKNPYGFDLWRSPRLRILPNPRTFVNVVQHLCEFGRFEIDKRDLGRQREDRILEEEFHPEIEN
jgi:hypothetical protein